MIELVYVAIGITLTIIGYKVLPILIRKFFPKRNLKCFEVTFKIEYYQSPSLFNNDCEGNIIKSPPITIKIRATDSDQALHILEEVVREETKGELISINEIPGG